MVGEISPSGKFVYGRVDRSADRSPRRPLPVTRVALNAARTETVIELSAPVRWSMRVSPDERWVAYASDRSGQFEVYVQALSGEGGVLQVSVGGGHSPRWSRDGRTIYYGKEASIIAARVTMTPGFSVAARATFREAPIDFNSINSNYDVEPRTGTFPANDPTHSRDSCGRASTGIARIACSVIGRCRRVGPC